MDTTKVWSLRDSIAWADEYAAMRRQWLLEGYAPPDILDGFDASHPWQPIESAPKDTAIWLAAFYEPSEFAAFNGSRAFWHTVIGRGLVSSSEKHPSITWTNILGGKPTHWRAIKP